MSDALAALTAALASGDGATARRLARDASVGGDADAVLDLLGASAASGSPLATELVIEHLDATGVVRRFVGGMLLDRSAVDDVCQDTLISVAGSVRSFAGDSKFTTWVHRIARNRVVDHLRRGRPDEPLGERDLSPAERMSSMLATRSAVRDVLAGLPDLYREPVTLRDIDGLSYAELAQRLGRSIGTVKSQVARGRALVAARLEGAI